MLACFDITLLRTPLRNQKDNFLRYLLCLDFLYLTCSQKIGYLHYSIPYQKLQSNHFLDSIKSTPSFHFTQALQKSRYHQYPMTGLHQCNKSYPKSLYLPLPQMQQLYLGFGKAPIQTVDFHLFRLVQQFQCVLNMPQAYSNFSEELSKLTQFNLIELFEYHNLDDEQVSPFLGKFLMFLSTCTYLKGNHLEYSTGVLYDKNKLRKYMCHEILLERLVVVRFLRNLKEINLCQTSTSI